MSVKGCTKHRNKDAEKILYENSIPVTDSGCWLWLSGVNHSEYGRVWFNGKMWLAHRLSYATLVGDIPSGMMVCHKCDTPQCLNPDHLFVGTAKENAHDASRKGRLGGQAATHCVHGHPLSGDNLIIRRGTVDILRQCRTCQNERNKAFMREVRARNKADKLAQAIGDKT